jgi:hypothetical protein
MMPLAVGTAALCWLAWRPCEPVAQAHVAEEPSVLKMPEVLIVADPVPPAVDVNSLPRVRQGSSRPVAHHAAKPATSTNSCDPFGMKARCDNPELLQGTIGTHVLRCSCQ